MVQQLRKSITTLAFFAISATAAAQAPSAPLTLRPDAPERYVVVPGDTLWSISQRYTDSPWRWPELWGLNKDQIRNPHLIYPGYVIMLDRARGQLTIGGPAPARPTESGSVKLGPRMRVESLAKEQIPSIPAAVIEPFLTRPLIVEPDGLDKAPTIVGTQADRVILATGNSAYVRGIGASKEETWYVYRRGVPLVDPDSNQTLAYEAIYLGTAQLERGGEPATVKLTSSVQEVGAGDKLVAAGRPQPISYAPRAPASNIRGRVISIHGGLGKVGEAGPQSIISINRGARDGLEVGHVLALYTLGGSVRDVSKADATIKLPDERAGLAFVFRVFNRVSYALVMTVTRPISPLDVVQTP
ncbi:MAG: LysM peptidoglycan-binding domain-containing protein [Betaproteobacteria bacterium]|nr:MAG: LysM peptidoglycan-binding domain-containing protein [Betaproteobacteria bacterium]